MKSVSKSHKNLRSPLVFFFPPVIFVENGHGLNVGPVKSGCRFSAKEVESDENLLDIDKKLK